MTTSTLNPQTSSTPPATLWREARATAANTLARLTLRIDAHPARAFAVLTLLYLVAVASLSFFKLLWLDELITLHIARLNNIPAIWHALAQGADPNPPVFHLAVMLCRRLFGDHEFALRLPAILGYWLGMVSLFLFLKRRLTPTWAIAGTLMSMANAAFDYSFESRSYGLFYGLAMLALLCWSRAVDSTGIPHLFPRARLLPLAAMVLALALGISTNYFAVLPFFAIAAGELVRSFRRMPHTRRFLFQSNDFFHALDARVWAGLALAATPLLAFRPLIERSIAEFAPHAWNKVSLGRLVDCYTEMVEIMLYPLLALFVLALALFLLGRITANSRGDLQPLWLATLVRHQAKVLSPLPPHELAAAITFMCFPVLGYLIAKLHGGMLSPRFVVPVCLGFAIMGIAAAFRLFGNLRLAAPITLVFCLAWFVSREAYVGFTYNEQKQSFYRVVHAFPATYTEGPIVISDPLMALTFQHYAPPALARRVVFPLDFPAIRTFQGDDSPEQNIFAGRGTLYHLPLVPLSELQRTSTDYLILAADRNWLVEVLKTHNYPIDRLPIDTRAKDIGGFTPIAHGLPAFFVAAGDRSPRTALPLIPGPSPFNPNAARPEAP